MSATVQIGTSQRPHPREPSLTLVRRKLLCATDLSARSDEALERAVLLSQRMNAEVLLVHAVDDAYSGRVIRMKMNRAQARLLTQSERAMRHAPQDGKVSVRLGDPVQAIAAAAAEFKPDLILMGAPRRRRLDFLTGATAERVLRATHRPVLIVNTQVQKEYESIVLATDLSPTSVHVARTVVAMGMLENAYAWVVHAFEPPYYGMTATPTLIEEQLAQHRRRWRDAVRGEVVENLAQAGVDLARVHVSAEPARPIDAIERAIQRVRPDLLVIGASRWCSLKRLVFGNTANEVFRKIDCDILAISPPAGRLE